jgi:hypothetical protein
MTLVRRKPSCLDLLPNLRFRAQSSDREEEEPPTQHRLEYTSKEKTGCVLRVWSCVQPPVKHSKKVTLGGNET